MNKRLLLVIPLVFCLASCMEEKQTPSLDDNDLIPSESVIEDSEDSSSETSSSEEVSSSEVSSEQESSSSEEIQLGTKTFDFHDSKYATTNYGVGDSDGNKAKFINALNQDAGEEFFADITVNSCFFNVYGNVTNSYTLVLGSSSQDGNMTIKANYEIYEIRVNVQLYNKYIEYSHSWNVTTFSKLTINGSNYSLTAQADEEPEIVEKIATLSTSDNKVKLASSGGRILIHSMMVTYKIPE